jgi:hypothetical protein
MVETRRSRMLPLSLALSLLLSIVVLVACSRSPEGAKARKAMLKARRSMTFEGSAGPLSLSNFLREKRKGKPMLGVFLSKVGRYIWKGKTSTTHMLCGWPL